ncbi:MAG: diguanylate cyclase [Firmicutes bacterium]|nr:diguanylate cyclase [Bacillota bacterium]
MKLKLYYRSSAQKLLILSTLGLFTFIIFTGLTSVELSTPYLVIFHGLFEIGSIILGFVTFFIGWYGANSQNHSRITAISLIILSATILELVHMLFYTGLLSLNSAGEHVWITTWIFSRLIWSSGLLFAITLPTVNTNTNNALLSKQALFYCTLIALIGLVTNIVMNYNLWPNIIISTFNHPLAIYLQYAACLIDFMALFILRDHSDTNTSNLLPATLLFSLLTDLCFSLGLHTPYSINFAGHFFKLLADFFMLKYVYILVIGHSKNEIVKLRKETAELTNKNIQLSNDFEQQRDLFEDTLAKVGMIISSQLNVDETIEAIADMIADTMNARQSIIALFNNDHSVLQVAFAYGINTPPDQIPLQNSLAGQACLDKTIHQIDDTSLHPDMFKPVLVFSNIRSMICAPLVKDHEVFGIIEAYSSQKGAFNERDALLLKALAHHASAAITSAKLFEQTKMRLSEEQFLYQIAQFSAATSDIDTILEKSTHHAVTALGADIGIGFLATDEINYFLNYKVSVGLSSAPESFELTAYPELAGLVKRLVPTVTSVDVYPPLKDIYPKCIGSTPGMIMVLPLPVDHRPLGLIILGWRRFASFEQLERHSFAALMAQQIALGLEKANLDNQVKAMALSDSLTGLANRRNFDMFLKTELRRAAALKRPLSLIMLDLDKFKVYNDTYGHPIGDELLNRLGKIIQQAVRGIDLPARYGGEEFSIILPECTKADAICISEKIRQTIEISAFPDNIGTFTARITASIGVATYDPATNAQVPDNVNFIAMADCALYQAKNQGRNQVCTAPII